MMEQNRQNPHLFRLLPTLGIALNGTAVLFKTSDSPLGIVARAKPDSNQVRWELRLLTATLAVVETLVSQC